MRKPLIGASRTSMYARAPWWAHSDSTAFYLTLKDKSEVVKGLPVGDCVQSFLLYFKKKSI